MKFCPQCGVDLTPYLKAAEHRNPRVKPETKQGMPKIESGTPYNQDDIWRSIQSVVEARHGEALGKGELVSMAQIAAEEVHVLVGDGSTDTVVHVAFDRSVSLPGGTILSAVASDREPRMTKDRLLRAGYQLNAEGHVVTDQGSPIPAVYRTVSWWGGDKQYRRWHMSRPVDVRATRNGNPCFIDDNMLAFKASWRDAVKAAEAFETLLNAFQTGVNEQGFIANPVTLLVTSAPQNPA